MGDSRARQGKYKRNHFVPERRKYSKNNRNVSKVHKTSIQIWDNLRIKICDDNPGGGSLVGVSFFNPQVKILKKCV